MYCARGGEWMGFRIYFSFVLIFSSVLDQERKWAKRAVGPNQVEVAQTFFFKFFFIIFSISSMF